MTAGWGTFQILGYSHGVVLLLLLLGSSWILITQRQFPQRQRIVQGQRYGVCGGLALQILVFQTYHLVSGDYDAGRFLPFHLCSLSAVMVGLSLWLEHALLRQITIYWAPVAALIAIVLPDIGPDENFPTFRFLEFFASHLLICWGCVWLLVNHRFEWTMKTMAIAYGALVAILPLIWLVNWRIQGNYMYMMHKPNGGQMDFLGPEPYHFVPLVGLVLLVFVLEMLVFRQVQRGLSPRRVLRPRPQHHKI